MKVCVLQPDYSTTGVDYKNYDPPRDLSVLIPEAEVHTIFLNKLTTYKQLKQLSKEGYDIFVNLCEGYLEWEVPSIDVIYTLEILNLPFTGPTTKLYDPPKELMKYLAYCEGVKTPGYVIINELNDVDDAVKHLSFPLFVKPAKAGDSLGVDEQSLVHNKIELHQKSHHLEPLILKRSEAYIGVLIDDLISKGTKEPYRMFTSRAEFRTLLRQDNADLRLTELSYRLGLASQQRMDKVIEKKASIEKVKTVLKDLAVEPNEINTWFQKIGSSPISEKQKAQKILLRPDVELDEFAKAFPKLELALQGLSKESVEQASIQVKYDVYIEKEKELVQRMSQLEELEIPETFDYKKISSLGNEAREKLTKIKPRTLGQASRISGINPSDVQILMVFMGR